MELERLFSPLSLRAHELRNRIVFTAHTASFSADGIPGERVRAYYEARAVGGAGLIVMEPLPVLPSGGVTPQNYRWEDERFVPALRSVVDAVHQHGTVFVSQLYHLGPNADPVATLSDLWSVSGGPAPGGGPGAMREIDAEDIAELVAGHVRAARVAVAAGVDGVECMFAYDTLVDGFMSEERNRRTDAYGGTLDGRMRLAREILDALRSEIGDEPLLGVTATAAMPGYVDAVAYLAEHCDVDYFGIGNGNYDDLDLLMPTLDYEPGFGIPFARAVKERVPDAVVIAEGRITRPELAERALAEGSCDLVGMTRAQIADPQLGRKAESGRRAEIRECVGLNVCVARRLRKFPIGCIQNPGAGFETQLLEPAPEPVFVVVVGAGVAGLEAARVAATRGHRVTLLERETTPGGQVALTASLPRQSAHTQLVEWRLGELERLGVRVEVGVDVDVEAVVALAPAFVVVATGSEPDRRYDGVRSAVEVLRQGAESSRVVVIDEEGHRKGAGVAEALARAGCDVTLVGDGIDATASLALSLASTRTLRRLREVRVRVIDGARVVSVSPNAVEIDSPRGPETLPADSVVHAGRHRPVDGLVPLLRERGIRARAVGDARAPGLVDGAIRSAHDVAAAL
ncbi:MAG TPA: FAD-dependent oxidoreductase [Gaiellaceae bacterium]|nr:FAD-dependent oxidoreductase [Gaiellaceae bacterium]